MHQRKSLQRCNMRSMAIAYEGCLGRYDGGYQSLHQTVSLPRKAVQSTNQAVRHC